MLHAHLNLQIVIPVSKKRERWRGWEKNMEGYRRDREGKKMVVNHMPIVHMLEDLRECREREK